MTQKFKQEFIDFITAVSLNNELIIINMNPDDVALRAEAEGLDLVEAKLKAPEIIATAKKRIDELHQFTTIYLDYLINSKKMTQDELDVLLFKIKSDYLINKYTAYQNAFLAKNGCKTPEEIIAKLKAE